MTVQSFAGPSLMIAAIMVGALSGANSQQPAPDVAMCGLDGAVDVVPAVVPLGSSATVTITALARCPVREVALGFGFRGDEKRDDIAVWTRDVVATWLRRVDLEHLRIAIVSSEPGTTIQPLTRDRNALLAGLWRSADPRAQGFYHKAIMAARRELVGARTAAAPDQAMIVLGDTLWPGYGLVSQREAELAAEEGIEIFIVCMHTSGATDASVLASSPAHAYQWEALPDVEARKRDLERTTAAALRAVEETVVPRGFQSVAITSTIPLNFAYVPDSAAPPAAWDPSRRTLAWSFASPPTTTTVTYEVTPLECGTWEVPIDSWATGVDLDGNTYRHDYAPANVEVPCPTLTPTATPTVATATPTATATRTSRPTAEPVPLYLPVALSEQPCSVARRTAVALVVDTSSSMLDPTVTNRTKLEAAVDAASAFVDLLRFPQDQAAVVGFDSDVVLQELTNDATTVHAALSALASEPGTDIAAGVEAAHGELISAHRRPENFPVMVVLTDGKANDGPQPAIDAARAAKDNGVALFTVGLGADIDRGQLLTMASEPAWYHEAADAEDLRAIYEAIAVDLPCPPDTYWGRR